MLKSEVNEQKGLVHAGNPPLVSIIITSYNYEKFLSPAIDSALQQTYSVKEITAVDKLGGRPLQSGYSILWKSV